MENIDWMCYRIIYTSMIFGEQYRLHYTFSVKNEEKARVQQFARFVATDSDHSLIAVMIEGTARSGRTRDVWARVEPNTMAIGIPQNVNPYPDDKG
jgi:hypothetical protein